MIICVCNRISSSDIQRDPTLLKECGTGCGTCVKWLESPEGQQYIVCLLRERGIKLYGEPIPVDTVRVR